MQKHKLLSSPFFLVLLFYAPVIAPLLPKTNFGSGIPDFSLFEICLILWIILLMIDVAVKNTRTSINKRIKLFPWNITLLIYTLIVLVSLIWSEESCSPSNISYLFFTVVVPCFIVFCVKYYVASGDFIRKIVKHAALSCFLLSIISIIKFLTYKGLDINAARSGFGGLANPNGLAIFLVLNVPVILYGIKNKIVSKKTGFIVLLVILGGVLGTISRKGIITLVTSYFIFLFFNKSYRGFLILFVVTAVAIAIMYFNPLISHRFSSEKVEIEFAGKWNMAKAGVDLFTKKPILGWGFQGYYNNFGNYFPNAYRQKYDAHNNYITALSDYGLVGFTFFMCIFLIPLGKAFKKRKQNVESITLISFLVPFMMSAWFAGGLMYDPVIINLLYTYIAIFYGAPDNFSPTHHVPIIN